MYRLAIPTILFALINFFPKKIIRGEGIEVKDLLMDTLGGCSLWFTCSLVLVELFIFVILLSRSNKEWIYLIISVLIALIGLFVIDSGVSILGSEDFPWFYKRATIAQFYVICGGVFCKYENQISRIIRKWYILALLSLFYFAIEFVIPEKALCLTSVGQMNIIGASVSIVGSMLLIELCRKMKQNKVLTFIGKNSIVFYFFSGSIPVTLCALLSRVMSIENVLGLLIVFVLSLSIGAIVAYGVKCWLPWLLDFRIVSKDKNV